MGNSECYTCYILIENERNVKEKMMTFKRWMIMGVILVAGFLIGRLLVRIVLNMLLGGTIWGGNFL
jgi:hypothetical protein